MKANKSKYPTIEQGAQQGLTFWQWHDNHPQKDDWAGWLVRHKQLCFEAQQAKFEAMKKRKVTKLFIVTNRWGWPEGGTNCKSFKLHTNTSDAAKEGLANFGKGNFVIEPWARFCKTAVCKAIEKRMKIREKLAFFKQCKQLKGI